MVVQELVGLLGFKTDQASVQKAQGGIDGLIKGVKIAAAAFAGLAAIKWVKGAVDQVMAAGQEVGKYSARLGISTDAMQRFGYAAKLSGADLDSFAMGLQKMQIAQVEASKGNKSAVEKFKTLGVEIKNSDGTLKNSADVILEVADGIKGLKTDAEKTAAVIKIFGRGSGPLVGMFKKGSAAIMDMSTELEDFGAFMEGDLIDASRGYKKEQRRMDAAWLGMKVTIARNLIPTMTKSMKALMDWWKASGKIIRQDIGKFFSKVGKVASRLSTFLIDVGNRLWEFWRNLNPTSKGILKLTAAVILFIKYGKVLLTVLKPWMLWLAIIVLLIDDLQVFLEGGSSVIGRIVKKLKEWTGIDFGSWIRDLMQALNILAHDPEPFDWGMYYEEMVKVTEEHLAAAAATWCDWLHTLSNNVVSNFLGVIIRMFVAAPQFIADLIKGIVDFLVNVWERPKQAFLDLFRVWETAVNTFYDAFRPIMEPILNWFDKITGFSNNPAIKKLLSKFGIGFTPPTIEGAKNLIEGTKTGGATLPMSKMGKGYMAPSVRGGTSISAPTSVNVSVQGTPGMNEPRLANETAKQVSKTLEKQNRRTMQTLVPQKEAI